MQTFPNGGGNAPASGPVGTYTGYTLRYTNNGGTAGPVYIKDQLPPGFTYVASSGAWNGAIGTQLSDSDSGNPAGISYKVGSYNSSTGTLIEAVVQSVQPGQSGTISFQVLANSAAAGGTTLVGTTSTNNAAAYTSGVPTGASCVAPSTNYTVANCNGSTTVAAGAAPFTVLATRGVVMTGSTGTVTTGADTTAPSGGNAAGDAANGVDTETVASGVPGAATRYTFKVFNKGNDTDTFLLGLSTAAGANTFPSGTTFSWFQSDGVTPLLSTAGKPAVDTGPLAAGANTTIVLQIVVPAATPAPQSGTPLYTVTVQATSVNDSTVEDGAKAHLTALSAGYVDLTQTSVAGTATLDQGPGTSTVVQAIAVTAGASGNNSAFANGPTPAPAASALGSAVFALNVNNNDTVPLTFTLSASSTNSFPGNLPAGWNVEFYTDATATGTANGSVGARDTGPIAAGGHVTIYAKVTPPSNAAANTYDIFFQVKSTTNATSGVLVSDYLRDQVVVAVGSTFSMNLSANGALQAAAGGSATYAHTLTNTGSSVCGSASTTHPLSLAISGLPSGWTYSVYLDTGTIGVIDGESPMAGSGAGGTSPYTLADLPVGNNTPLLVRVFPPAGAAAGDVGTVTVTVTDPNSPGCGTTIASDTTTVVANGQVQVTKYQAIASGACSSANYVEPTSSANITSAKPGDCLMYKSVATNQGTTAVTNVTLNDQVPAYTTWASAQPATACSSSSGTVALATTPASGAAAGTTFSCGTVTALPPNGTLTLRFSVQINQ